MHCSYGPPRSLTDSDVLVGVPDLSGALLAQLAGLIDRCHFTDQFHAVISNLWNPISILEEGLGCQIYSSGQLLA